MKTALITGITGQDGSYLSELLVSKGYRVVGAVRDCSALDTSNLINVRGKIDFVSWDMLDQDLMRSVLNEYRPAEIYNFAAYSSGSGMFDDPVGIGNVNGLAVARLLEAIREVDASARFCQASSREIFGEPLESPQTESTVLNPRSPYGAAKQYADSMIRIYRQRYGVFACSAILYNHESPRRGLNFVTRKVTSEVAKIKLGFSKILALGSLDSYRDWGYAGDYVRAMFLMLQHKEPDDYIVATGKLHSVRELCELAFSHVGLNYLDYVQERDEDFRPNEISPLVGSAAKANSSLCWYPEVSFEETIGMMVDSDLKAFRLKS